MNRGHILVVDDLPDVGSTTSGMLEDAGFSVRFTASKDSALQLLATEAFDVAILDVRLDESDEENQDGILLMYEINEMCPSTIVIILTGYPTMDTLMKALQPQNGRRRAFGYVNKKEFGKLTSVVEQALLEIK